MKRIINGSINELELRNACSCSVGRALVNARKLRGGNIMALNLTMPESDELKPKITVFGVGGAGGNAVNNMIEKELEGVDFVVANTDAQALQHSLADEKIQIGIRATEGLGAGARPSVGAAAAEESIETIVDQLAGSHMCFITAGMGGGTGTGAAPIIAQAARELGVLTVGVVTKPFQFEGGRRMRQAEEGVEQLQKMVDTLIIIPNQNLFRLANEKTTFTEAFSLADDVLYQGVKGVTDLMVRPGLINLDFADVRAVMDEMGKAMMGTGEASGEDRAVQAAEKAIANPLLDEISLKGAKGVLINITGGDDLTLFELDEAANRIREEVDPDANIIVGSTMDDSLGGAMRVSVVATGIDASSSKSEAPAQRRRLAEPLVNEAAQEAEQAPRQDAKEVAATSEEDSVEEQLVKSFAQDEAPVQATLDVFDPQVSMRDDHEDTLAENEVPAPVYKAKSNAAPAMNAAQRSLERVQPDSSRAAQEARVEAEVQQRLAAAMAKEPKGEFHRSSSNVRMDMKAAIDAPMPTPKSSRFGLNSLIGRMTGQSDNKAAHPSERNAPPVRSSVYAAQREQNTFDEDHESVLRDDKIEVPAFLRRQAN